MSPNKEYFVSLKKHVHTYKLFLYVYIKQTTFLFSVLWLIKVGDFYGVFIMALCF